MDLYENFQGLKHTFENVRGCFYKISRARKFSLITKLFSTENSVE
jgi:hypothetical protein